MVAEHDFATTVWVVLEHTYGKPSASNIYGYFREILKFRISGSTSPEPELSLLGSLFGQMDTNHVALLEFVKAMITLTTLCYEVTFFFHFYFLSIT
ncbi:MAG: hypothetical protein D3909_18675 [Candidatus Electrothrix sp. ATG1]|nr:hypothetical protein [Candidatus Electrothrix sp. ATG1]